MISTLNSLTVIDGISGAGQIQIGRQTTFEADAAISSGINVIFKDNFNTLMIDPTFSQGETISGFISGDAIELMDAKAINYAPGDNGIGTLTVTNDGTQVTSLKVAGDYTGQSFVVRPDTSGDGTKILLCFCEGTRASGRRPAKPLWNSLPLATGC